MTRNSHADDATGLYLSVPFCRSKCTFCNFASGVYAASELPGYVERLHADIMSAHSWAVARSLILPRRVDTVYLGGGTPSILAPAQLRLLFAAMREQFTFVPGAEITLEAAPGLLADDLLSAAAEAGVTRISFGVQTFVDAEARAVGRLHTPAQARADVLRARQAGLAVSLDLIAGLPGQTAASWRQSLDSLVAAAPKHASVYMLEVDEDSRLGGELLLGGTRYGAALTPGDDAVADFYDEACEVLEAAGLAQYEISNFARAGHASRHNQRYWRRRPYLGLGLDAHSMLRTPTGAAARFGTSDDLQEYLRPGSATDASFGELNRLSRAEELEEAWFLGLRMNGGVSLARLRQEFAEGNGWEPTGEQGDRQTCASTSYRAGLNDSRDPADLPAPPDPLEPFIPVLAGLADDGLLRLTGSGREQTTALTPRGRLLSNEVFTRFLGVAQEQESRTPAIAAR